MQPTTQSRQGRGAARWLAGGAVALVVLGLVGVILALHNAGGAKAAGVTATTPPDAVHVVVTEDATTISTVPVTTGCPTGYTCGTDGPVQRVHETAYDKTITDAATVQRLQRDLNAPASRPGTLPDSCKAAALDLVTYDFTFTAGGQTVEHVVMRTACNSFGIRAGYAPDLTLGTERDGDIVSVYDVMGITITRVPEPPSVPAFTGTQP